MTTSHLSPAEERALAELEDEQGRGEAISWDEQKTVRGVVVRDVETVTFQDKNDGTTKEKRVLTLRTADGLMAIFEGPAKLNSRLFEGEQYNADPLGPPAKGQLVIVTFKGERVSQTTGRDYKDFEITRGPAPTSPEPAAAAPAPAVGPSDEIPF